jgi:hypothetical protein
MKTITLARTICAGLFPCALLIACDRPVANAASVAQQYDIVTRTRPESRDDYLQVSRGLQQVCNATRAVMNLPPGPPLVELPADFVTERTRYLASGGKYVTRHETFFVDTNEMTAEAGCKSRIVSEVSEELVQNGKVQGTRRDSEGKVEVDPIESLPPAKHDVAQPFTEHKKVSGIALRCVPAAANPLGAVAQNLCAPELNASIALDGRGEAIVASTRAIVAGQGKMVLVTEPVSVEIGKPVAATALTLTVDK